MSIRTDLEKRIERERQKIVELKAQVEKSEAFVQGLQEALKMLPRDGVRELGRKSKSKMPELRRGGNVEKTYNLLRQLGKGAHISEILVGIGAEDTKANRLSLSSTLSRYVRSDKIFSRPGPNTFALKEIAASSLPPEFGTDQ